MHGNSLFRSWALLPTLAHLVVYSCGELAAAVLADGDPTYAASGLAGVWHALCGDLHGPADAGDARLPADREQVPEAGQGDAGVVGHGQRVGEREAEAAEPDLRLMTAVVSCVTDQGLACEVRL